MNRKRVWRLDRWAGCLKASSDTLSNPNFDYFACTVATASASKEAMLVTHTIAFSRCFWSKKVDQDLDPLSLLYTVTILQVHYK